VASESEGLASSSSPLPLCDESVEELLQLFESPSLLSVSESES